MRPRRADDQGKTRSASEALPSGRDAQDDAGRLQAVPERAGVSRVLQLFATGALGGVLTMFGLGVLMVPRVHRCCSGASASQRAADAETRRRCMELGVTPDELAALDAAAGAVIGGE